MDGLLYWVPARFSAPLLPASLHCPEEALHAALRARLFGVPPGMGGLLVGYEGLHAVSGESRLAVQSPHYHVVAEARLLIFRAPRGCNVTGRVTEIADGAVGLLLGGVFSAAVRDACSVYRYDSGAHALCHGEDTIVVGSSVCVRVVGLKEHNGMPIFYCSLQGPGTGLATTGEAWVDAPTSPDRAPG